MPLEKRDPVSKARLFIPTNAERSLVRSQTLLNEKLKEVDALIEKLKDAESSSNNSN
ncbi:hypothetical protein 035JT004_174 [Bacillus phage 035JT004]|nr:hypothetical protein 035JT004_174 [Bacillus phage 035JT004]